MSDFHFLRPEWFLLLLPALAASWLVYKHKQTSDWHALIPDHLAKVLFSQDRQKQRQWLLPIFLCTWLLSIIAAAGPTWNKIEKPVFKAQLANVLVMDMSLSMRSTDITPDRLTRAKFKAIDLAQALGDGEVGLVAYAGDAFTISPLTQDPRNIAALIPNLSPEIMPVSGSYPLLGLEQASELMRQAGYLKGQIYWITDGIEQDDMDEIRSFIANTSYQVNVLALGTRSGAPIKQIDGSLLKDQFGRIVMPKLNDVALKELSHLSGGFYQAVTANDADIKALASQSKPVDMNQTVEELDNKITGDDWNEFGPYIVLLILPVFLFLFRRGVLLSLAYLAPMATTLVGLMLAASILTPSSALAAPATDTSPPSSSLNTSTGQQPVNEQELPSAIFKTKDQLGQEAFNSQDFEQAKALFENRNWRASAAYKAGDYETALELFSNDQSAEGLYNKANSLAQLGQFEDALEAYNLALEQQPSHKDAQHNKALIEKALQQQQEQEQQKQNQDSDQQSPDQENSDQQNSEQQNSEQQDSQNQNSENQNSENQDSQPSDRSQQQKQEQQESQQQSQQASEQDSEKESDQEQQAKQQKQAQEQDGELEEGLQSGAQMSPEEIAKQEQEQKIQQLLRKVKDDPSLLIRNKMILESRRRQQERRIPKGVKKSW
jgi:Ca-activated chloride channel homolog